MTAVTNGCTCTQCAVGEGGGVGDWRAFMHAGVGAKCKRQAGGTLVAHAHGVQLAFQQHVEWHVRMASNRDNAPRVGDGGTGGSWQGLGPRAHYLEMLRRLQTFML